MWNVYTIANDNLSVDIADLGATVVALRVNGLDVALGYGTSQQLLDGGAYLGGTVGRNANRIAKGRFMLNGTNYQLAVNNGVNHLHGGVASYDKLPWAVSNVSSDSITFTINSCDGDEGYPGNVTAMVTYTVSGNSLNISYVATSDKDTPLCLTNHSYFNLNGHDSGDILDHTLMVNANSFAPVDETLIPTGEVGLDGNLLDLRVEKPIGEVLACSDTQLTYGCGIDHNYCVHGDVVARLHSDKSGLTLLVATDLPCLQVYTGNHLAGTVGKTIYTKNAGIALETQLFPDNVNNGIGRSCILKGGESWKSTTSYTFVKE